MENYCINDGHTCDVIYRIIRTYHEKPHVPYTTFGRATLGANGVAYKLLIASLFSLPDDGV